LHEKRFGFDFGRGAAYVSGERRDNVSLFARNPWVSAIAIEAGKNGDDPTFRFKLKKRGDYTWRYVSQTFTSPEEASVAARELRYRMYVSEQAANKEGMRAVTLSHGAERQGAERLS
jgi:hypothetical protein